MARRFGWLTDNIGLKLISLLLAIGFWFYAIGEESIEVSRSIPLDIRVPNKKLSIVDRSTEFLRVTFEAPRHLISTLSEEEMVAVHEISEVEKAGRYSFKVAPKDLPFTYPEVHVVKMFPPVITVTLDEMIVKKLLIKPALDGEPAFGYRVDKEAIQLDPNAVLVEGPKAILEQTDTINTEPIQLVGRVRSFRRTVRIQALPETEIMGDGITDVQVPIIAEFSDKEFGQVPVKPLGTPAAERYMVLESQTVPVTIKGPRADLNKLEEKDLLAYVDVEGLKEGDYELPVHIILPPELSLKEDPPLVSVRIKKFKI